MAHAPVVIFTYNRYKEAMLVMEALAKNTGAAKTDVYVYSNAPQIGSGYDEAVIPKIRKDIVKYAKAFRSFRLTEREENTGPNQNMYPGIDEIVHQYGRVIVLEDDIVAAKGFLAFMNQAFEQFQEDKEVFSICGYNPVCMKESPPGDSFSYDVFRSWGWGIWADRWDLLKENPGLWKNIDLAKAHSEGLMYISAIRHDMIHPGACQRYLDYGLTVTQMAAHCTVIYSTKSLCDNIGINGSGQTCTEYDGYVNRNFDPDYEKKHYELAKNHLGKCSYSKYFFQFRQQEFAMEIYRERMFGRDYLYSLFYFGLSRLYLKGGNIAGYFQKHHINKVSVYGDGIEAELFEKLLYQEGIEARHVPGDGTDFGDAVLVTELEQFDVIEERMWNRISKPVISVDDVAAWCLINRPIRKEPVSFLRLEEFTRNHSYIKQLVKNGARPVHQGIGLFWDLYFGMFWIFASGNRLGEYFIGHGWNHVAIYDKGYAAEYLYEILQQDGICAGWFLNGTFQADVLVVTDVRKFGEIRDRIKRNVFEKDLSGKETVQILSLYDIVMETVQKLI